MVDFGQSIRAELGPPRPMDETEALEAAQEHLRAAYDEIQTAFARAGFYRGDAEPYPAPQTPWDLRTPSRRPKVDAVRQLWIGHWNPSDDRFFDGVTAWSDVDDPALFPWGRPEDAVVEGWWVSTNRQKGARLYAVPGDLLLVQRQRPGFNRTPDPVDRDNMYVGLAAVLATLSWLDSSTSRYESRACLLPLCHFDAPVPITTAKQKGRLADDAFSKLPATQDRKGLSRQISAVPPDAAADLLSVCGLSPKILAEADLATIAARLAVTPTGNPEYLALRYDDVVRQAARKANELRAEEAAKEWARVRGYFCVARVATIGGLGYDLLFEDGDKRRLQVEAKGYSASRISAVHLQPSQECRAREAAAGVPPDWRLYALLDVATKRPKEEVYEPHQVVDLIDRGILSVNWSR